MTGPLRLIREGSMQQGVPVLPVSHLSAVGTCVPQT